MSEPTVPPSSGPASRIQYIIAAYLEAVEAGQSPDREALLRQHPDVAAELRTFFADHDRLARLRVALHPVERNFAEPLTLAEGEVPDHTPPATVRYFGDYELLQEIARGGMGVVFKARQLSLNRPVALKMILAGQLASTDDVARFRREAEAAANLDHPNIVSIYEVGEHEGQQFFSMKLVEGSSLAEQLATADKAHVGQSMGSRDVQRRATQLLVKVARAVHHAHQRGILHRDLKPGNILLDPNGEPLVTDFGLAKRVQGDAALTQTGAIVGTPSYMAPEQARAEKQLTTAVDVYSMGAILYEQLTGRPPFQAATALDTLLQLLDREPEAMRLLNSAVDRDLETICVKCLHKVPERRYESAAALADDLQRWLQGEPIRARPTRQLERLVKWVKRRPAVASLLMVVVFLVVIGFALVTWKWRESLDNEQSARAELSRAEMALYVNRVARAFAEWKNNAVPRARALLAECPPKLRGWEWHYVQRLCEDCLFQTQVTDDSGIHQLRVTFSPDGRLLAAASQSRFADAMADNDRGELFVWDVHTGKEVLHRRGHFGRGVAISADGKRIASGGWVPGVTPDGFHGRKNVTVWDLKTGQESYTAWLPNNAGVPNAVAFSPDGRYLVGAGSILVLFDARTGREVRKLTGSATAVSFSPDGRFLAAVDGEELTVLAVDTGKQHFAVTPKGAAAPGPNRGTFLDVAYSRDGRRLVTSGTTAPGDVRLWDAATGAELAPLRGLKEWVRDVAWSADGRRLAVACWDTTVKVFNADSGLELFALRGHTGFVQGVAFSPDGSLLASGGSEQSVRLWDATRGQEFLRLHESNHRIDGLALSADGQRVAMAIPATNFRELKAIRVCAADNGRDLLTVTDLADYHGEALVDMAFSPDGGRLAVNMGDRVRIWDIATGRAGRAVESPGVIAHVLFTPTGDAVVLTLRDGRVVVRAAADGREQLTLAAHARSAPAVTSHADGLLAAVVARDSGGVCTLELATGEVVGTMQRLDGQPAWADSGHLSFSTDGRRLLLCESNSGSVFVWDVASGRPLHWHPNLVGKNARFAAFNPSGTRLAVLSDELKEITLWDTSSGQQVFALEAAGRFDSVQVWALTWSADGSTLAVADSAGNARLWNAAPRTPEIQAARRTAWARLALGWHDHAARDCEREKQWFAAGFHLTRLIEAGPADGSLLLRRGLAHAHAEHWSQAAEDLGRAMELRHITTFNPHYQHALLLWTKGDVPAYRRAVAYLLAHWANTTDARVAQKLLQAYMLDGGKAVDHDLVKRLVRLTLSAQPVAITVPAGGVGTALFQARNYTELSQLLGKADLQQEPQARLSWRYVPLIAERLGDKSIARLWFDRATKEIDVSRQLLQDKIAGRVGMPAGEEVGWEDVLALNLLQREIESLQKKVD
jgi:WD40 repeat protein/serine/threonine protein kinase